VFQQVILVVLFFTFIFLFFSMKKLVFLLSFALIAFAAQAQGNGKKPAPQPQKPEWAEMKAFHQVMAGTFHPLEEGNFEPIRKRAGEMAQKALAWQKSTPPADFNKPEVAGALAKLVSGSDALAAMVGKNASNDELKASLTALHDTFHTVVGLCKGEGHGGPPAKGRGKGKGKGKG